MILLMVHLLTHYSGYVLVIRSLGCTLGFNNPQTREPNPGLP